MREKLEGENGLSQNQLANCLLLSVLRLSHASLLPRPRTVEGGKTNQICICSRENWENAKSHLGLATRKERRAQLAKIVCMRRDNNNNTSSNNTRYNNARCNNNNSSKLGKYLKKPIAAAARRSR